MGLTYSTLIIFFYILPGFIFLLGAYKTQPGFFLNKDTVAWKAPGILAIILSASFATHLTLIALISAVGLVIDSFGDNTPVQNFVIEQLKNVSSESLNKEKLSSHLVILYFLFLYLPIACFIGWVIGKKINKWIYNPRIPDESKRHRIGQRFIKNDWAIKLIRNKGQNEIYAHVLTKINISSNSLLMYTGQVTDLHLADAGEIKYLVLSSPSRHSLIANSNNKIEEGDVEFIAADGDILFVRGSDISNILFFHASGNPIVPAVSNKQMEEVESDLIDQS